MLTTIPEQLEHWRALLAIDGSPEERGKNARDVATKLLEAVERLHSELARSRTEMAKALDARLAAVLDCGAGGCPICHDIDAKRLLEHAHKLAGEG